MTEKIFTPQVSEIREYIKDLLEYLDGRGIIFEDENLVDEALDSLGSFPRLREILAIHPNDIEPVIETCDNCGGFISISEYAECEGLCFDCRKSSYE